MSFELALKFNWGFFSQILLKRIWLVVLVAAEDPAVMDVNADAHVVMDVDVEDHAVSVADAVVQKNLRNADKATTEDPRVTVENFLVLT